MIIVRPRHLYSIKQSLVCASAPGDETSLVGYSLLAYDFTPTIPCAETLFTPGNVAQKPS